MLVCEVNTHERISVLLGARPVGTTIGRVADRVDAVVVRPQDTADDGDIVVAMVGEEATVKRFFREADHIRLQPENATMEPIRSRDVKVLGRVVGLFRSVR